MATMGSPRTPRTPHTPAGKLSLLVGRSDEYTKSVSSPRGQLTSRSSSLRQNSSHGESSVAFTNEDAEAASKAALEEIERDEIFRKFLADGFNATKFASEVLASGSAASSSRKLNDGIVLLERQLRSEVVLRHDELLQQLTSLRDTEAVLAVVRAGVDSLQSSVQRVRSEIAEPHKQVKSKTRQLASLHDTMELLRSVVKVLKQVKRLREHMAPGGKVELAKAAQLYSEIEALRGEVDLAGVDVVEAELPWVHEVGQEIRTEAMKGLEAGMEALNQAEVGSVLQVYFNMGELRATVDIMVNKYKVQATKAIVSAMDMKALSATLGPTGVGLPGGIISRGGTPGVGGGSRARDVLWQRMSACADALHSIMVATWHLQRVLAKKRDPISHVVFLDVVVKHGDSLPTSRVWDSLVRTFTTQSKACFSSGTFLRDSFVSSYPRLLSLVEGLVDRLARDTEVKGVAPAVGPMDRGHLAAALEPFQSAYLGQSLQRLTEPVSALIPQGFRGALPAPEASGRLIGRLAEEVEALRWHEGTLRLVLRGVGKAMQLLAERAEYQVNLSPDARQVSGSATPAQQRNAALCALLQEVHLKTKALLAKLPAGAGADEVVGPGLAAVHSVAASSATPLFTAMVERIESCLLLMHDQNFGENDANDSSASAAPAAAFSDSRSERYMEEAIASMAHFRKEFLSSLLPSTPNQSAAFTASNESIAVGLTKRMASRILLFFVRHAALIRPLSENGKLRLARDMGELEFAIGQYLFPAEQLGAPYRALRAFRPFLFLETTQIPSSPLLQDIPPSAVLHHLFSRAPEDLESPMKRNQLTPARFSLWLDRHTEEDAWKEVKACLDAYARKVQSRGDKEFSPIYPLILDLGQVLVNKATTTSN